VQRRGPAPVGAGLARTERLGNRQSARDVQHSAPSAAYKPAWSACQAVLDLGEQPLATVAGHGYVAGEGAQQTDVALGVVVPRPVQVLDRDHIEEPGGLDLLALIGQLARSRMRRTRGQTLAYGVVYLLDLIEERVAAGGEDVGGAPDS
jgi:hypothetical protein